MLAFRAAEGGRMVKASIDCVARGPGCLPVRSGDGQEGPTDEGLAALYLDAKATQF